MSAGPWTRVSPVLSSFQLPLCPGWVTGEGKRQRRQTWREREEEEEGEGRRKGRLEHHKKGEVGTWELLASAHQWGSEFKTTLKIAVPWPSSPCLVLRAMPLNTLERRFENPLRTGCHMGADEAEAR